ncbi:MAG TPA: diguanylate cyclase [Actinomycetota bacterium]|nr:diguanylate cyclase [Actinomycetota bacterium]
MTESEKALVLLVEDSPTQALRTRSVLTSGGFDVEVCGTGEEGLEMAAKKQPDLILLDMNLPDIDGRQVANRLKSDPTCAGIPIIFLTGVFREVADLITALEEGGDDYLVKPVEDGELLARVKASVRAKKVQRALGQLVRILLSVNQVGNQIAGILDRAMLLDSLVKLVRESFDYSLVNLYSIKNDHLVLEAFAGPGEDAADSVKPPLSLDGDSLIAQAARQQEPVHWGPTGEGSFTPSVPGMKAALAVPFRSVGEIKGVIEVLNTGASITEHDRLALLTLADLLGMAIHNAHLYREMEELAMFDGLTGLPNRRSIMSNIEIEFERARRYQRSLTVLSVDIDTFKLINDTHGHLSGDKALVAVADAIREATRRVDLSGRIGGDEFIVVLPETDQERALVVAERIRKLCARLQLDNGKGETFRVSISVGIASLPETEAENVTDLLAAVDQALYRAKEDGRNRISV